VADALEALKAGGLVEEEPAAAYAPCLGAAVKVYEAHGEGQKSS